LVRIAQSLAGNWARARRRRCPDQRRPHRTRTGDGPTRGAVCPWVARVEGSSEGFGAVRCRERVVRDRSPLADPMESTFGVPRIGSRVEPCVNWGDVGVQALIGPHAVLTDHAFSKTCQFPSPPCEDCTQQGQARFSYGRLSWTGLAGPRFVTPIELSLGGCPIATIQAPGAPNRSDLRRARTVRTPVSHFQPIARRGRVPECGSRHDPSDDL